jgi:Raf kinase inhibitor-like YbhB/YbcL family protein
MVRRAVLACIAGALVARAGSVLAFELTSTAFPHDGTIPERLTCDGGDLSPALAWKDPPGQTKAFALVCDDPDAPAGVWVHWVIYGIAGTVHALAEGLPPEPTLPDGSRQGVSDFKRPGYGGPCPPRGQAHRYFFRLYALDADPGLPPGATKRELLQAIEKHTLGTALLMGRYKRRD